MLMRFLFVVSAKLMLINLLMIIEKRHDILNSETVVVFQFLLSRAQLVFRKCTPTC